MEYNLENKVIIVTGGANGIGFTITDKYLEQKAKVAVIADTDEEQGKHTVKILNEKYGAGKADFIKCDVTKDLKIVSKYALRKYNTVDVLVLNAGMADDTVPRLMIDVLVTSVVEWSLHFLETMRKDKCGTGGTIIINSSIFGFRTAPFAPVYQASKFAVLGFAKSLGHPHNFQKAGVRVLTICPGFTETQLTRPLYNPEYKKSFPDQELVKSIEAYQWQKVEKVGEAAVEIFKKATSGTVWVVEAGELREHV